MDDIIKKILEVEGECAAEIRAHKALNDERISRKTIAVEKRKNERKKKIITENGERYKKEINRVKNEISRDLSALSSLLDGLKENHRLCNEVQDKIISLVFKK
ncbi:MAG TPA: hypothetical protein PK926_01075 [Spirochaetota bacterium]|nr:hypothetical protein [Spirochaetota bacterium]HPI90968.1 hypothetical protein [Spirochaetota bacterium]HPR47327.1 hypothetical protein [Spirochaetota bacterium]